GIAAPVAPAGHVVHDQSFTVSRQDLALDDSGEELVFPKSFFVIPVVADAAPINRCIGGNHTNPLFLRKTLVYVPHSGNRIRVDWRFPAQNLSRISPHLADLLKGYVLAIFVAIKNGLIEGISTLEHQRPGILGKFRVADKT